MDSFDKLNIAFAAIAGFVMITCVAIIAYSQVEIEKYRAIGYAQRP